MGCEGTVHVLADKVFFLLFLFGFVLVCKGFWVVRVRILFVFDVAVSVFVQLLLKISALFCSMQPNFDPTLLLPFWAPLGRQHCCRN